MYGIQMKDTYDDEGNLNDNEHDNRAMIAGHQSNNYDMRRTHEMLQDDGFRRHMKQEGFKGVDRMVKDNMPSTKMLSALNSWGKDIGTHNGKGSFDTRDLGATFKSFANENSKFHNERVSTMMDDKMQGLKDKLQKDAHANKPADEANNYELSESLQGAQDRLNNDTYTMGLAKGNDSELKSAGVAENPNQAFDHSNASTYTGNNVDTATGSYLEGFKKDLIKAGQIGSDTMNNVHNAKNYLANNDMGVS